MLHFNSLVLITTNICNLKCRHCYPTSGSSPVETFRYGSNKFMSVEQAERYVRQIPGLSNVNKILHFGGGESTLFAKEFKGLVALGKKYGLKASMVTNCSWAKDQKGADEFIGELKNFCMTRVQVSLSVFHQEFLSIEYPLRAIRACKRHGLDIVLRPIGTKSASVAKTLQQFPDKDLECVVICISKCLPVGRAKEEVPADEFLYQNIDYGGCQKILNLTIRQDGSVYPCCAGSDITNELRLGNADTEPLFDILARAELDPLLIALIYQGPRYLAELLKEADGKDFLKEKHVNICHLCNDLFINDEIAKQVREALESRLEKRWCPELIDAKKAREE